VKLDIVHEHVLWFSSRGMEFPQIEIEVPKEEEVAPRYSIHPLKVHHETIAGKTAIVNVVSGDYFTTTGSGSFIWNAIAAGFDLRSIASALASANMPDASDVVADFMLKLVEDDLVVASDTVDGAQGQLQLPLPSGDALPSLTRHQDARALIATMPFGSSDAQTGWPSYR
jgi:hypothetical protein